MSQIRNLPHFIATILFILFLAAGPTLAGDIHINIQAPLPTIVLSAPTPMVWLPGLQVYVAHNSPHHLFHHEGHYYLRHQNAWYIGPGYSGPWTTAYEQQVPHGLRGYRDERWSEYQREATQNFRDGRDHGRAPFYAGRESGHAHERAHWKDNDHDRGRHADKDRNEKRGHGRGRGNDD